MPSSTRDLTTDVGLLALAVIWGVNFSVVKAILVDLHPLALNALRFPLAALALWMVTRKPRWREVTTGDRLRLVALGILGNVVYQLCFIYGIDATLAGNASLLLATSPVWTILLSALRGHEHLTLPVSLGATLTLAGMGLVVLGRGDAVGLGADTLLGDGLMVLAALLWATYTVGSHRLVRRYGPLHVTSWTLWMGTPLLVLLGAPALYATEWSALSPWIWVGVAYAGVFSVALAYLIWYRGVQRLGNARTAVYSNLVPVAALLTAWVWLGEVPTVPQLAGAVVILLGLWLARRGGRAQTPGPSSFRWRTSGNS